jgi:hypothetical protein
MVTANYTSEFLSTNLLEEGNLGREHQAYKKPFNSDSFILWYH